MLFKSPFFKGKQVQPRSAAQTSFQCPCLTGLSSGGPGHGIPAKQQPLRHSFPQLQTRSSAYRRGASSKSWAKNDRTHQNTLHCYEREREVLVANTLLTMLGKRQNLRKNVLSFFNGLWNGVSGHGCDGDVPA